MWVGVKLLPLIEKRLCFVADLRLVKEIRPGKNAREFEKNYEDAFKHNAGLCFVIVYGSTFKLKTLALVGNALTALFNA